MGKRKTLKKVMAALGTDSEQADWPEGLRCYVASALGRCLIHNHAVLTEQLKSVIKKTRKDGTLHVNWDDFILPPACSNRINPRATGSHISSNEVVSKESSYRENLIRENLFREDFGYNPTRERSNKEGSGKEGSGKNAFPMEYSSTEISLKKSSTGDSSFKEHSVREHFVREHSVREHSVRVRSARGSSLRDTSVSVHSVRESLMKGAVVKDAIKEIVVKDIIMKDVSGKDSNGKPIKRILSMDEIEETPDEKRRRKSRAERFKNDKAVSADDTIEQRIHLGEDGWVGIPIVGTCQDIEKPYFRLTSAARPGSVRPLDVLRLSFKHIIKQWERYRDYAYVSEQMKSLRQDLMVQGIRNDFTARVYKANARIALEKGDLGEFNQCQTQLKILYSSYKYENYAEFLAYRILYLLFQENNTEMANLLQELQDKQVSMKPEVKHAMMVRSALSVKNYCVFFRLYLITPNMGGYLMDTFITRVRKDALSVICKAYKPSISIDYLSHLMAFASVEECRLFLQEQGMKPDMFTLNGTHLATKANSQVLL
ncbi:SAC3/GANP/Nin1/mts3/eIF-3 p25 family-domain-containing protein [Spinellus fusiger]|nr:SAC3/GANP/Nin1/mts3/eIF-3 p25 family-domain-containing protein [Spinellus fusiger]